MTYRITHVALGDPEGPAHLGDEFDCPVCRARLLESFRAPATAPEPRLVALPRMEPGEPLPHLILGAEHSRTVDLDRIPRPGHDITARTRRFVHLPGGSWAGECTCGWTGRGIWTPEQGEEWGLNAALEAGGAHRAEKRREEGEER